MTTQSPIDKLHEQLREEIAEWDADDMFAAPEGHLVTLAKPLVDRVRAGEAVTVAELAQVCRAMAWDVASFYEAFDLRDGDYHGLIQLNGGVYFNLDAPSWDT